MAVYTDVAAEDLVSFLAGYDIGELMAYKGIAEGVENSNFLVHTSRGYFILTLYERRVAERDLPFFWGSWSIWRTAASPVRSRSRTAPGRRWAGSRPAGGDRHLPRGHVDARPSAAHCAALGEALARLHLAGADFAMQRENALSVAGWRQLYAVCRERANEVQRDLRTVLTAELAARTRMAARTAAGRHPRRPVSRQRLFPRRQALGADRFLFRLQRHAGLRRGHLPQRLVLRADVPTTSPRAARCSPTTPGPGRSRPQNGTSCRCWRAERRCAFCSRGWYDWLDVPPGALVRPKDPLEYLRKLRFHQKVKSPADYGVIEP